MYLYLSSWLREFFRVWKESEAYEHGDGESNFMGTLITEHILHNRLFFIEASSYLPHLLCERSLKAIYRVQ